MTWVVTNEREDASPLFGMEPFFRTSSTQTSQGLNVDIQTEYRVLFQNGAAIMAEKIDDCYAHGESTLKKLQEPGFAEWLESGLARRGRNLIRFGSYLRSSRSDSGDIQFLHRSMEAAFNHLVKFQSFNHLVNSADFYHNILTNKLIDIIEKHNPSQYDLTAGEAYSHITIPNKDVWTQEEEHDFARLLISYKNDDTDKHLRKVRNYLDLYFWMKFEQQGQEVTLNDVLSLLKAEECSLSDALNIQHEISKRRFKVRKKSQRTLDMFNFSDEERRLFLVARMLVYWKLHLREIKVRYYCCAEKLLLEASNYLALPLADLKFMTQGELLDALLSSNSFNNFREVLKERRKYSVFEFKRDRTYVYVGKKAASMFEMVTRDRIESEVLHGTCGASGKAEGIVQKVLKLEDVKEFTTGNVLVAYMTDVSVVPAMRRASAIVTDVGGITCHAAIIAREFEIPCVIGTRTATSSLSNGDYVLVDGSNGYIEINANSSDKSLEAEDCRNPTNEKGSGPPLKYLGSSGSKNCEILKLSCLSEADMPVVGSKAFSIFRICCAEISSPHGVVIPTTYFHEFMRQGEREVTLNELLDEYSKTQVVNLQKMNDIFYNMSDSNIDSAFKDLQSHVSPGTSYAVRSSAIGEDGQSNSWAGQYDSFLNVESKNVAETIPMVWASMFSEHALCYRSSVLSSNAGFEMAVIVQEMVTPEISGTAFSSISYSSRKDSILIELCNGLGESLVSGAVNPVRFIINRVDRKSTWDTRSAELATLCIPRSELDLNIIPSLVEVTLKLESYWGSPIDLEWCYESGNINVVQARPITSSIAIPTVI